MRVVAGRALHTGAISIAAVVEPDIGLVHAAIAVFIKEPRHVGAPYDTAARGAPVRSQTVGGGIFDTHRVVVAQVRADVESGRVYSPPLWAIS